MAIQGAIPVAFGDVFPHGAYASGDVKEARDWDKSTRDNQVQQRVEVLDPETSEIVELPVWLVTIHDGDPEATQTMTVQVISLRQPVLPAPLPGTPFRPIELDGLALDVYVNRDKCRGPRKGEGHQCRAKVAHKFWASEVRPANGAALEREAS